MSSPAGPCLSIRDLRSALAGPFRLDIASGECVSILGKSGSGKSLFLRLIADLDPGTGTVALHGRTRDSESAPQWRRRVVYQAAEPAWWAPTPMRHFEPDDAALLQGLLPRLGLAPEILNLEIARLSTGERQRLALVRSLARRPSVLLLDEPTASLDQSTTLAMEDLLQDQLKAGLAIVLVTHSREQAGRMSSRSFEMNDRQLHPL